MGTVQRITDILREAGVNSQIRRLSRRDRLRDYYHFGEDNPNTRQSRYQLLLRYECRFCGLCLYIDRLDRCAKPPSIGFVLWMMIHQSIVDRDDDSGFVGEDSKRRAERVLGSLKMFLGSRVYWDIVNLAEPGPSR